MNIVYDSENSIMPSIDWEVLQKKKIKLTGRGINSMTSSQKSCDRWARDRFMRTLIIP